MVVGVIGQSQEEAQQRSRVFKETLRQMKEDEQELIRKVQIDYERKLYTEKQTNAKLQEGADILTQKVNEVFLGGLTSRILAAS